MALKLIKKITNQFVSTSVSGILNTKENVLEFLIKEKDILNVLFAVIYFSYPLEL